MAKSRRGHSIRQVPVWTPEGREVALLGVSCYDADPSQDYRTKS